MSDILAKERRDKDWENIVLSRREDYKDPLVLDEEEMLLKAPPRMVWRSGVARKLIRGTRYHKFLTEEHTIVTGWSHRCKPLHRLMDDLYYVYSLDPKTENGCAVTPWIDNLRCWRSPYVRDREFHIYAENGIPMGWFSFTRQQYDFGGWVPTMTFVWVVPRFRRQGLFSRMYKDLMARYGDILIDDPNEICSKALETLGYPGREGVLDSYGRGGVKK